MGVFIRHEACDACGSSDGRAVYDDKSHHCFVCQDTKPSEDHKQSDKSTNKRERKAPVETKDTKPAVTEEQTAELKSRTITNLSGYRSLDPKAFSSFGNRAEFDENDELKAIYYPCTQDNELVGWKCRTMPKEFGKGNLGRTGKTVQLYGQFKFTRPAKYILIVGGENDTIAAWQMLQEYQRSKGQDFDTPVVAPTIGETGADAQIAAQYAYLDQFDTILLGMDNDDAGKKATEKILKVLPRGKVRIVQWTKKDPHLMLEEGLQKQFIKDYYAAKQYVPSGIVASNQLSEKIREELNIPKVPLPPFMHRLQDMMAGGIPLGRILNLGSASGTGKSTILDEMIYYWLFNSPHLPGIVSLESSAGQYGTKLLSRHISNKLELLENQVAMDLIDSEEIKQKEFELFNKEDGSPRFYLVDERDGGVDALKVLIENLVVACGCRIIVLDPIQDALASLNAEQQEEFMAWQKGLIKSHFCSFINVSHVRKNGTGQKANSTGADLHEEDFHGSSSIFKSGACNLLFMRDKENEDPIVKNTTRMKASKIRWTGVTGLAGEYYYDNKSHTMYDKEDYFQQNASLMEF